MKWTLSVVGPTLSMLLLHCNAHSAAGGGGNPDHLPPAVDISQCTSLSTKLTELYQRAHNGKGETVVADNVAMIQRDCQRDPALVVPCVRNAVTASDLTLQCTIPIDDLGSEGAALSVRTP